VNRRGALGLALLFAALAGCASLRGRDEARWRAEARVDDAACTAAGYSFPSHDYTDCRRLQAERRQRKQWSELALAQQLERNRTPTELPVAPPGVYLPIDPDRFTCQQAGPADDGWIDCRER
jgi:hypothetical protein